MFGEDVEQVELTFGDRRPVPMTPVSGTIGLWSVEVDGLTGGRHKLTVAAASSSGVRDSDAIELDLPDTGAGADNGLKPRPGDQVHSVGASPERGLLGTQLGPNKNGVIKW